MNAGARKKKWLKYCLNSKVLDRFGQYELRYTEDVKGYNPAMYVIVHYSPAGRIDETASENIWTKEQILKTWQRWKEEN